jgi:hypothetical protein
VTNLEGPLTRTVKDLSLRTEQVTDGYINGLRKRYIGPIRYLLIVFTLTGFFTILFLDEAESNYASLYLDEYAEGYRQVMGEMSPERLGVYEERLAEVRSAINGVFSDLKKYANLINFLMIPLVAFFSHLMFSRAYNYTESLVAAAYLYTQAALLILPGYILYLIPQVSFWWVWGSITTVFMGLLTWLIKGAYQEKLWRSLLLVVLTYIFYGLMLLVFVFIYFSYQVSLLN